MHQQRLQIGKVSGVDSLLRGGLTTIQGNHWSVASFLREVIDSALMGGNSVNYFYTRTAIESATGLRSTLPWTLEDISTDSDDDLVVLEYLDDLGLRGPKRKSQLAQLIQNIRGTKAALIIGFGYPRRNTTIKALTSAEGLLGRAELRLETVGREVEVLKAARLSNSTLWDFLSEV